MTFFLIRLVDLHPKWYTKLFPFPMKILTLFPIVSLTDHGLNTSTD